MPAGSASADPLKKLFTTPIAYIPNF
jgi:hypothetical protein